jgi:hypothetical protein
MLEYALQPGALLAFGGIRAMAAIAVIVKKLATFYLLRIQAELRICLAAFYVAAGKEG